MRYLGPLFALLFFLAPAGAGAQRLSGDVIPEHYTLWFAPDLNKDTFRGRTTIDARTTTSGRSLTLHAAELSFGEVTITAGGRTQKATVTMNEKDETATLTVAEPIGEGAVTIDISYTGILNDKLRGFYRSTANGRKYALSQLEATDARRAFPSFDEPRFKATFDVSLTVPQGDTVISNGLPKSDTPGPEPGTHTVVFERTPKMSTYLVAMLVGDFVCRSGSADGTAIRVCTTPDKIGQAGFALQAAQQQLAFFNNYFDIKYPFGKLDIIGIPDFAAGAMENAGAITFRERALLVDEATGSVAQRKVVASVVAHEIAHQWFGNLVTMKWWDDIWLNEGFATWAANKPLAVWRPDWKMEMNVAEELQAAMGLDTLSNTRAIRTRVETTDEINEVFDPIAYEKTGSVLAMIEAYVGPEAFRRGVSSYLKRFSYSNASGEDFWAEMTRVTGKPVDQILRSFVDQPGIPLVSVEATTSGGSTEIKLTQQRFWLTPSAGTPASQSWTLPVCIKQGSDQPRCEVISRPTATFKMSGRSPVFVNAFSRGYYLTEYTPSYLATLAQPSAGLTPAERLSLLGDEWRLIRSGRHDIGTYLDLAHAWAGDTAPAVIEDIAGRLGYVASSIANADERPAFQAWTKRRFGPALEAVGLPGSINDSDDTQSRRAALLGIMGGTGDPAVTRRARELAEQYLANPTSIPPTLVRQVLQVAAASGGAALYDRYVAKLATSAAQPEEYNRFLNALTAFQDPALVKRTLEYALSDAVRSQDAPTLIAGALQSSQKNLAWDFVRDRWGAINAKLGVFQGLPAVFQPLGSFCDRAKAEEISAFFAKNRAPAAARLLQQSLERIDSCTAIDARQSAPFAAWLKTER
jgi:aminopeptidase N